MNLGAIIALLKLAQDVGITEPTARKITFGIPTLTYEQTLDGGPSRLGLRPKTN